MIARRSAVFAALTVLACVLPAGAAQAAGVGQIASPEADAAVADVTAIVVEVTGDTTRTSLFEPPPPHEVQVRFADADGATLAGTTPVDMTCETDCNSTSTWTAPDFDPATLAPFARTDVCNGGYTIQVRVDGGAWTGHGIRVAHAPAAPGSVAVTSDVGEATVTWEAAGDPDVAGYRVQRRVEDGSWSTVATRPATARSLTDTDVAPGTVAYRVATLRGDGRVDGEVVAPCADTEPDLSTAAPAVSTTVPAASASSSPSSGSSDPAGSPSPSASGQPADDGSDGATEDPSATEGTATRGADADGDTEGAPTNGGDAGTDDEDAAPAPRRTGSSRVAPPNPVDVGSRPSVTVEDPPAADGPQVASQRQSYYGDGEGYSEELDFGDADGVEAAAPTPETTPETRVVRVPGAFQQVLGEELDLRRLAGPIAAGLILVALALHLRRWMRAGVES